MREQPEWGKKIAPYFVIPQRVTLAIMGLLAILNAYTMRICISVAITQLVIHRNKTESTDSVNAVCPRDPNDEGPAHSGSGEYDWDEELQGMILSSFYIGYVITHLPGGVLAEQFGGKWVLSLGILSTAIFTFFTPLVIRNGGANSLIFLRIFVGAGEGTTFPALSALLSKWVPLKERSKLGSLVLSGGLAGTIAGNSVSGILLHYYTWDFTFYFFGAMGIFWFILFTVVCYNDPGSHPFIKQSEKDYLLQEMGTIDRNRNLPPTPWLAIMTNGPMLALIFAQIGHDWGLFIMITDLPKYMADVMQFPIKKNGVFSALPYVAMWIVALGSGVVSDAIITREIVTITNARKLFTAVAAIGPAVFLVSASYAGCNRLAVVALFTIGMGSMGPYYAGMKLNALDFSPNYAGTLMAITNGIGSITGVIAPYLVGVLTPNTSLLEWRLVFWLTFTVLIVTCIIYVIWASGEVQPFDNPRPQREIEAEQGGQK